MRDRAKIRAPAADAWGDAFLPSDCSAEGSMRKEIRPESEGSTQRKSRSRAVARGLVVPRCAIDSSVLDRLSARFILSLTLRHAHRLAGRRDWNSLLGVIARQLVWPVTVLGRLRAFLGRRLHQHPAWAGHEALDDAAFLARHGAWCGPYEENTLFFYLDEYIKDAPKDLLAVFGCTHDWLAGSLKHGSSLVQDNVDRLAALLQLNAAERALLLYGTLARSQRELRGLLVEFKVASAQEAYATLAEVAGVDARDVADALRSGSRLERIGMVENLISEHNITDLADLMKVSDQLPPVLMREYRDRQDLMAVFTRPATRSELTPGDFGYVADEVELLTTLLRHAVQRREAGVNLLLYGPPGTGKTELARVAAQAAGLDLYEVEYADREGNSLSGRDRYRSLQISQVFLKGSAGVALLFDEVEDVFPAVSADAAQLMARLENHGGESLAGSSVNGKAWVNQILETNPVPVIWVTNRIEQIDTAFRRRFQYHLELKSPPPGARDALVRKALAGVEVSADFTQRLSQRSALTPAQIRTAVRFARLIDAQAGEPSAGAADLRLEALIERQLTHADKALGSTERSDRGARPVVTQYDLGLLNVESRFPIPRIVEALLRRGHGALCFYGPPGTGKTALAEHIASELGRRLMVRQASDLVSKYVGETEQAMARMFEAAEQEQAVLLLDEADSFMRSRRRAERNYEVSEVNEMLQGMERFAGIFICTTNLFEDIDEAALRRFTFKIRFLPLTARSAAHVRGRGPGWGRCPAERRTAPAPGAAGPAGLRRLCRRKAAGGHPGLRLRAG
jgi:SpoVK/Ycf46/Vps4 family AAA+-type ATPase